MTLDQFNKPRRVWVNAPSTLQPDHKYHGKTGIGVKIVQNYVENGKRTTEEEIHIFFTEGDVTSFKIDPLYLSEKH